LVFAKKYFEGTYQGGFNQEDELLKEFDYKKYLIYK